MQTGNKTAEMESITRILEERAQILARRSDAEEIEGEYLDLLTFPLANEQFGFEVELVREVQPLGKQMWSLVPCTPDFIVGAANIRGRIYSVMHIGRFLGINSQPLTEQAHVLLVRGGDVDGMAAMELCIVTDGIPEVRRIAIDAVQTASTTVTAKIQEYVRGVTDDMLTILDLERLLADPGIIVQEE